MKRQGENPLTPTMAKSLWQRIEVGARLKDLEAMEGVQADPEQGSMESVIIVVFLGT